jgi:hypothetical protein
VRRAHQWVRLSQAKLYSTGVARDEAPQCCSADRQRYFCRV